MNIKKISALAISAVMAFSTIVNAATTKQDASSLRPTWTIAVEKLNTKSEVSAASTAKYAKDYDDSTYDYYKLTYTLTNLGDLANEYWEDILGIYNITLGLKTTSIVSGGIKAAAIENTATKVGQDATVGMEDYFQTTMTASGGVENPYPASDPDAGNSIQTYEGSIEIPFVVAIAKGTTVTVNQFYSLIVYVTDEGNVENPNVTAPASLTIGESTPEPAGLALTANLIDHYADRGYIWNATVTKGEGDITGFNVSFTAPEGTKTGSIQNIDALTNKYTGAEFTFQVGLKTKKTLTSAAFSITDTNGTVEAPTVPVE